STNFKYNPSIASMKTLGTKNGYQFLWKEAEAKLNTSMAQFTFLNDQLFYTISSLVKDSAEAFFTRIGANDPNFNLRREPSYILRTKAANQTLLNVIELHGGYSAEAEIANGAYSSVSSIKLLQDNESYTAGMVTINGKQLIIIQSNKVFDTKAKHQFNNGGLNIEWTGPYAVFYSNQIIK
ncbi:MAG: heparinase, partial [Ignavibacteria bacterium]|nr:heparinase [Ignavibacteria bacterium]